MSADEDTELRDLVAQTLEANGVLGKIRAQLRASVFLALEEQESIQASDKLDCSRNKLSRQFGLTESSETAKVPLLASVVRQCKIGENDRRPSLIKMPLESEGQESQVLPESMIAEAKGKFDLYDKDNSGQIDKDELRELFCSIFPNFHRNMLDRYVNDEFRFADKDFSNGIDFEEFLEIYRRLIIRCKASAGEIEQESAKNSLQLSTQNSVDVRLAETNGDIGIENLITRPTPSGKSEPGVNTTTAGHKNSTGSDVDSDSFFDDLILEKKPTPQDKKEDLKLPNTNVTGRAGGSNMTSLADLPSLTNGRSVVNKAEEVIDLEDDDDKYDDDFQASNPLNQTPRSQPSSDKYQKSIEEIDEEIEEDLSMGEDLLKSDRSVNDDLTTDRTVSATELSAAGDYVEDILR